jgi:hypothetical protein
MSQILDARGNPYTGSIDTIGGETFTDARTSSATLGAANAEIVMDLNGKAVAVFDIRATAMNATLVFEGTLDGTNYYTVPAIINATESMTAAVVITTINSGTYTVGVSGYRRVRCRVSAYTSGNCLVYARASTADFAIYARPMPSTLAVTVTGAAAAAATLTIPAAGAGLYHYITSLQIYRNATAALAGTATLVITSTNLPGSLAWSVGNAMVAGGTQPDLVFEPSSPLKSSVANTATTIVMPAAGAAVLWRANVTYYVGA